MSANIIDTVDAVCAFIDSIDNAGPQKPLLFIDLEGVNLSRHGSIAIMQVLIPPSPKVHLVDVHVLKRQAFETPGSDGRTLRSILESDLYVKVFFDVRHDSDALYNLFQVDLHSVIDLQLLEYATRRLGGRFVNGLAKCISRDAELDWEQQREWQRTKDAGLKLFAPERGGTYDVFLVRPLSEPLVQYCVQDVLVLPKLLVKYGGRLESRIVVGVHEEALRRIALSQSPNFNGEGRHMAVGPNLVRKNRGPADLPFPIKLVCSPELAALCALGEAHPVETPKADAISASDASQQPEPSASSITDLLATGVTSLEINDAERRITPAAGGGHISGIGGGPTGGLAGRNGPSAGPSVPIERDDTGDSDDNNGIVSDEEEDEYRFSDDQEGWRSFGSEKDYTACSASDCGYCGHCDY